MEDSRQVFLLKGSDHQRLREEILNLDSVDEEALLLLRFQDAFGPIPLSGQYKRNSFHLG